MANFKNFNTKENVGKIVLADDIIYGIVLLAVSELDDVEIYNPDVKDSMRNKSIKVKFNKDSIVVDVTVKVNYTKCISDMAFKIQEVIRHNVESMTEYHIESVNVHVHGVTFDDSREHVEKAIETTDN
ncbi:MAG: Asp23/Gls24 family envelope stress response protein [Clostridia bacterium]|nr:Asp23/Gls24 family envelope stress response protein [Clostridia bacterium]